MFFNKVKKTTIVENKIHLQTLLLKKTTLALCIVSCTTIEEHLTIHGAFYTKF
jgi:hypothetical protein